MSLAFLFLTSAWLCFALLHGACMGKVDGLGGDSFRRAPSVPPHSCLVMMGQRGGVWGFGHGYSREGGM